MADVKITAEALDANQVGFVWSSEPDHRAPRGKRYVLRSAAIPKGAASPVCNDDRVAACAYMGNRTWVATFWLNYETLSFHGGTAISAMSRLEAELDKRSIGLFGVDRVTFKA